MLALLAAGAVGYNLLSVAALPNADIPTLSVTASLPGADPETNVVANYPFERSHRFAEIQPNLGHRDYSRAAALGDTQLVLDLSRRLARAVRHRGASLR
jgi:hypothetical protein